MEYSKQDRVLEIFFRGLRGEDLSVQKLANEYGVSTKFSQLTPSKSVCGQPHVGSNPTHSAKTPA